VSSSGCVVLHPSERYTGAQDASYLAGLTAESAGSTGLCMTVLILPPGSRSRAHLHRRIESGAYLLEGELVTYFGECLEHTVLATAGDLVYIPADLPHVVMNATSEPARAVVVHTAPDDQQGISLLPELDGVIERALSGSV
jgi:uncharacterized RmlC-like cupin family protein